MSRNFELLTQLDEQFTLFRSRSVTEEPPVVASYPVEAPSLAASTEEWALVQRVFLIPAEEAPRVVVFSGIDERGGSSFLCARAGEILAALGGGEVCLLDADLRYQALHRRYGVSNAPGATNGNHASGSVHDFAHRLGNGNLWLASARAWTDGRGAIVSPDCVRRQILEMREHSKQVLISAPPVNLYPDAMMLGQIADGVILVLKANSTRRATVASVQKVLEASKVRLLGAILTDRTFPIPESLYRKL